MTQKDFMPKYLDEINYYIGKLEVKLKAIEERIRAHYFPKYNINYRSFKRGLETMVTKHMSKMHNEHKKIKSKIKTYDPRDADAYKGMKIAE